MISGLITGTLASQPKTGTSASGVVWANCVVRCPVKANKQDDTDSAFVSVAAFGDEAQKLARLARLPAIF
jgi:predicted naringenin-chalcone synthase